MNDIETLWARIAEDPTQVQPQDIDAVIDYYRSLRTSKASGVKPQRDKGPKKEIDLLAMGVIKAALATPVGFKRRV